MAEMADMFEDDEGMPTEIIGDDGKKVKLSDDFEKFFVLIWRGCSFGV